MYKDIEAGVAARVPNAKKKYSAIAALSLAFLLSIAKLWFIWYFLGAPSKISKLSVGNSILDDSACPVAPALRPESYVKDNSTLVKIVEDQTFRNESVAKLLGAVHYRTVSSDSRPDPKTNPEFYAPFLKFHEYLQKTYPLAHKYLDLEHPGYEFNLLYTWRGSDPSLKPLVLMAHQDVVPVNPDTLGEWEHEPFEGYYDGHFLYGRGVSDCKSLLSSLFQAIELLIKDGFEPTRTVVLSLGFDEEVGGKYGAATLSDFLVSRYGRHGAYAIVDEGGAAIEQIDDTLFALPAVGEKGSLESYIELFTPGGHSSVPPDHTNIGIISELVSNIEKAPFSPDITESNPFFKYLQCMAVHATEDSAVPKNEILRLLVDESAKERVLKWVDSKRNLRYLAKTTQAVDIIDGGIKTNALPEHTKLVVNHRVNVGSSCAVTGEKILNDIKSVASKHNLGLRFNNEEILPKTENGYFNYTTGDMLEPAPVSPTTGGNWEVFSGTVKHLFEDIAYPGQLKNPVVVSPSITTGNTDTAHYWDLTKHIYRYRLATFNSVLDGHAHGVNEQMPVESHMYLVAFNYEYIRNCDAAKD